jgi:hypothetical protein
VLKVTTATVTADGQSETLGIDDLKPTGSMAIEYNIQASDGSIGKGLLHNTIHHSGE